MQWKTFAGGVLTGVGIFAGIWWAGLRQPLNQTVLHPLSQATPIPKPLQKFSFPNLQQYQPEVSQIVMDREMFEEDGLTAYSARYQTQGKNMSLQIMIPKSATPSAGFPTLLMVRGYVDADAYQTGVGTKNAARFFAKNGFVTIAPDFLGYGDSDPAPTDTIAARLERPMQLLDLLASFTTLKIINSHQVGIWGHSNGGQISLSLLEVSRKNYPTVLWAPVSKPFPYSILYYADDSPDQGKDMRKVVALFEENYDVFDFSIDRFIDSINAPIELHQGTADEAVPVAWSTALVKNLKDKNKDISYFIYPGNDHNLRPDWQLAADRSLQFFKKHLLSE